LPLKARLALLPLDASHTQLPLDASLAELPLDATGSLAGIPAAASTASFASSGPFSMAQSPSFMAQMKAHYEPKSIPNPHVGLVVNFATRMAP